jgi:Leucine-rich repeat (LRR) protein
LDKDNQLESVHLQDNLIENIDFINSLNPETIKNLVLSKNKIGLVDISVFQSLKNLEYLGISNASSIDNEEVSNKFFGSLSSLLCLKKLRYLEVSKDDFDVSQIESFENLELLEDC